MPRYILLSLGDGHRAARDRNVMRKHRPAAQPAAAAEAPKPNDYGDAKSWLCRPGRKGDACDVDLTTTVVAADGTLTRETWAADPKAPIDCFYVYPTVSTDPRRQQRHDAGPGGDQRRPAAVRALRVEVPRLCADRTGRSRSPACASALATGADAARSSEGVQYDDVRDAWQLLPEERQPGPRRGARSATRRARSSCIDLIREEIDGKPVQKKLVSAILLGATLAVPKGKDVGGAFKHDPALPQGRRRSAAS